MAEATLAWTLYLHRDMPAYAAAQRQRRWVPLDYRLPSERRIGLLGLGELGRRSAAMLQQAGFPVSGWSRTPKALEGVVTFSGADGLQMMLGETDVLICLLPLTPETRGLVGTEALAALPRGAALLNFGRGPVVDVTALVAALDTGHLAHAVLDVFETEPLPVESPLWLHPKVTVLPHITADTKRQTASRIAAANIETYLEKRHRSQGR